MALISIFPRAAAPASDAEMAAASLPVSHLRSQSMHRLQIGLSGIGGMLLLVGLAQVIFDRAQQSEAISVPEAAATVPPSTAGHAQSDPLVEAGVVPDLPTEPTAVMPQETAIMPEKGPARPAP